MANVLLVPPAGFDELPVEEQIDYVNFLWDRILVNRQHVPVPAWHLEVLDERMAELEANPDGGQPWDEFAAEVRTELASRPR